MLKTYIFDFDGTIADTLQLTRNIFNELSTVYTYAPVKDENIEKLKNEGARSFLLSLNIKPELILEVIEKVKQKESALIVNENIFNNISEVLRILKNRGVTLGILTNNLVANVESLLDKNNLNIFDFIISQSDFFAKDVLLTKILKDRSLQANETVYIGDEDRDVISTKKAGIESVAVTWGFNSEKLLKSIRPDYIVNAPQDLLKLEKVLY